MPNYCDCDLYIYSWDDDTLTAKIAKLLQDGTDPISFDKVIPYPARFAELDARVKAFREDYNALDWKSPDFKNNVQKLKIKHSFRDEGYPVDGYNSGGYEWCSENWGTKWDACNPERVSLTESELIYKFKTAWSPPLPVIEKLASMYPNAEITLEYYERGLEFCGQMCWENGELIAENRTKYIGRRGG